MISFMDIFFIVFYVYFAGRLVMFAFDEDKALGYAFSVMFVFLLTFLISVLLDLSWHWAVYDALNFLADLLLEERYIIP